MKHHFIPLKATLDVGSLSLCLCSELFLVCWDCSPICIKAFVSAVWWLHQSSPCNSLSVMIKQIITGAVASFLLLSSFLSLRDERELHLLVFYLLKYLTQAALIWPPSIFSLHTELFAHKGTRSILAICNFPGGRPLVLLISLSFYASPQMPNALLKQVSLQWMRMKAASNIHFFILPFSSLQDFIPFLPQANCWGWGLRLAFKSDFAAWSSF